MAVDVDTLVLLVGAQPLPNYLAMATLRPRRVCFVHTGQTRDVASLLEKTARERLGIAAGSLIPLPSATDGASITRVIQTAPGTVHLNYTGGTKAMAVHARLALFAKNADPRTASYVDDRSGHLLFDDGSAIPLQTAGLDMAALLELHGLTAPGAEKEPLGPDPEDAARVAARLIPHPELAQQLYERLKAWSGGGKSGGKGIDLSDLLPGIGPRDGWSSEAIEIWRRFLQGGWLEMWVESLVRTIVSSGQVRRGVHPKISEVRDFDIDVLACRGHRAYAIECTIDAELRLCKLKLFQVALRSRQLGGDLARSALVCMIDGQIREGERIELLQSDVRSLWDAPNVPRVFGLKHLRSWLGIGQAPGPDLTSLKCWLEE